ncbi:MAG: glycoside hydrolase family 97 catalytic domain-containing protein [Microbacterium gubbeenense]|uniref:glycoside hydrolase family 97 catalytic domain-containing protein n=2 Tax=Microbacterium gubbeenense TaxID=159896 RepID=UPI00040C7606|nr:glycoside hydrolase family 97 catalytic domain-containing protein [Microbacterium gubbeenense]
MVTSKRITLVTLTAAALATGTLSSGSAAAEDVEHRVDSPDGSTSILITDGPGGSVSYTVERDGAMVIEDSAMGLETAAVDLSTGLTFITESRDRVDQEYTLVEEFNGAVSSSANELTLTYERDGAQLDVVLQAHDDGVAFRYEVSGVGATTITGEDTEFALPDGTNVWASDYREARDYEDSYPRVRADEMGERHFAMPTLAGLADESTWALISESAVAVDPTYPAVRLDARGNGDRTLTTALPGPDEDVFNTSVAATEVPADNDFRTPWRAIAVGSLDDIANTSLFTDLAPAPAADLNTDWIRPGKALWSWWSNEEKESEGDDMQQSQVEYLDEAERLGMQYVTVDCCYDDTDGSVEYLADYARDRDMGIFIWMNKGDFQNDNGTYYSQAQVDDVMRGIADRGVAGVKIDFMQSDRLETIALYDRISKAGLEAEVLVNFHGSTKPAGENRTYPNLITSEAVLGSEQYKYGRPPTATDSATYPFTRNPVGGMDMTPVIFSNKELLTTHGHQIGQSVVFASAMQHFADAAAAYETWIGRHLLSAVPTVWDESHVVEGYPGAHATLARRSGEDWFVGSVSSDARTSTVPLDFLEEGTYTATVFADDDSDRQIAETTREVSASTVLTMPVRENGGYAVHISRTPLPMNGASDRVLEAEDAVLTGSASLADCPGCSGGAKIGNLGHDAAVEFQNITASQTGSHTLRVGYLSADPREFTISVNGGPEQSVYPPRSGGGNADNPSGWDIVRDVEVPVALEDGANSIRFGGGDYVPDIDRVIVETTYEAESPENRRTGNTRITPCEVEGCTGSQVSMSDGRSRLSFTGVEATRAGSTTVQVRYSAENATEVEMLVDAERVTVPLPSTGGTIGTQTVFLDLAEGANTITAVSQGGAVMVDALTVRQ